MSIINLKSGTVNLKSGVIDLKEGPFYMYYNGRWEDMSSYEIATLADCLINWTYDIGYLFYDGYEIIRNSGYSEGYLNEISSTEVWIGTGTSSDSILLNTSGAILESSIGSPNINIEFEIME
jgi:hypothetical protein